ncbi:MAG: DUF1275 domain-containing protein [Firmicutes bacterium]|nr:DUF1275 domain-containing protein [Bacillota bacterium]
MSQKIQMSDSYGIGALLALAGGFLDAYTYLCRGGVFANAQTGNIVLFGVKLAELQWAAALEYLLPIFAFFIGIFFAEMIKRRFREQTGVHWRQIILAVEILILLLVAWLPQSRDMLANTLVSFICSIQVEGFRKVHGNPYATTMCTGNLRSATEQLYLYRLSHDRSQLKRSLEYYGIILFFVLGAALGALFCYWLGLRAVLLPCLFLGAAFVLMFRRSA